MLLSFLIIGWPGYLSYGENWFFDLLLFVIFDWVLSVSTEALFRKSGLIS
jgi:hypothetical protein